MTLCTDVNDSNKTTMYVLSNNAALRGITVSVEKKPVIIAYSECVLIASIIQHVKRMRRVIPSSVACPAVPYFSTSLSFGESFYQHFSSLQLACVMSYSYTSVGIATRYGLYGPGIESLVGGDIFRTRPDRPWGPPSLLNGNWVFPGDKSAGAWR